MLGAACYNHETSLNHEVPILCQGKEPPHSCYIIVHISCSHYLNVSPLEVQEIITKLTVARVIINLTNPLTKIRTIERPNLPI